MWRRRKKKKGPRLYLPRVYRRIYQGVFLIFFLLSLGLMTDEGIRRFPVRFLFHANPLTAAATLASSWLIPAGLLLGLLFIAMTAIFGRAFCGWICPLGTLHQIASWLTRSLRRGPAREANRWRPHFRLKYLLFVGLGVVALSGSLQVGLLDPISLLARSLGSGIFPAASAVLGDGLYRPRLYLGAWLTGGILVALLVANRWIVRWWCRALCPLGAGLGWIARSAVYRIHVDPDTCTDCCLCVQDCQGADEPFGKHRAAECHVCLNCIGDCPEGAIRFAPFAPAAAPAGGVSLERRQLVGVALAGAVTLPLFRASAGSPSSPGPLAIRPPGALPEIEFSARCVRCGACVNACPTSALQPALGEAGIEGLWTPVLVARRGWCEPSCTLCGAVCPTGAIRPLGPDEKGWTREGPAIRIGTAFFDRGRCLPWGMATPCIVCQEVCPTSPKAIWLEEASVRRRDGSTVRLQQPYMDPARCVGCGLCEAKCPVSDVAAVRVTRVGESRDPESSFTLRESA
jgi:MauM/NapG family ferredoxin protein